MVGARTTGPDLVIAGSARSGTSYLASMMAAHPRIDGGSVKEPNYFSREIERGVDWYDSRYQPRSPGLLRMDASMSYTFPHFPEALPRLAQASPNAFLVYAAREPISRAHSHYLLHRDYFANDPSEDFGTALSSNPLYSGTSDYEYWLRLIGTHYPQHQVLVVPFLLIATDGLGIGNRVCRMLGIDDLPSDLAHAEAHRNDVVEFRHSWFRRTRRLVRKSGAYPWVRQTLGTERLRRLRSRVTRPPARETLAAALKTCDAEQLAELQRLYASSQSAVRHALAEQDQRLSLSWESMWEASVPVGGSSDLESALGTWSAAPRGP